MNFKKLFSNEAAVSPIVATLVLVVVAIAGAAAVGSILGTFTNDVASNTDAEAIGGSSQTELIIAGSTTVQPVSELLAEAYMKENPAIKITVQGGGSGAGISSTVMDVVDIGSASKAVDTESAYPDLEAFQIGGSAVVVIANKAINGTVSDADLYTAYTDTTAGDKTITGLTGGAVTLYQRAEESGTEETFAKWISNSAISQLPSSSVAVGKTGNQGVLDAVADDANGLGFVDFGYATKSGYSSKINIIGVTDADSTLAAAGFATADITKSNVLAALKGDGSKYYISEGTDETPGLVRPLNYLTNGEPSELEQDYIDFAMSPGSIEYFNDVGYFSILEMQ